jgi:hypothetical protein
LWQAEMARLGAVEKRSGKAREEAKPRPPVIVPKLQIKVEDGYWKAELTRVADTDTETLQVQKKTGLDKLAPPMTEAAAAGKPDKPRPAVQRDTEAEKALFEEEMARLGEFDGFEIKRAKQE